MARATVSVPSINVGAFLEADDSEAAAVAIQLAVDFLRKGNFEAADASIGVASIAPASSVSATPITEQYGFAGLSVQSVGYAPGSEDVFVYVTRGGKRDLAALSGPKGKVRINVVNLGKVTVRPEAASAAGTRGHTYERGGRIACGSSCAPAGEQYSGTLGALVSRGSSTTRTATRGGPRARRTSGALFALSNNHVFAGCNHVPVGQPIMAPSGMDTGPGMAAPRQVCLNSEIIELRSGTPDLVPLVRADAAMAAVPDPNVLTSWQGDAASGYDTPMKTSVPAPGMRVKKFGRTTGLTFGTVEALIPAPMPLPYKLRYFTAKVWFADIWTIRADDGEHFALPGDSGSLVVSEDGKTAIGLLFAVTNKGDYGFVAAIDVILANLNVTLVGDHGV